MIGYFSVKNFEKYQHYKDRRPPWIKLYNELLEDYDFCLLPDASKWQLVAIFLLASRYDNRVPADAEWVARKISATSTVDLTLLAKAGFIVMDQVRTEPLAICYQPAMPEREAETETQEKDLSDKSDLSKPEPKPEKRKAPYPESFEDFWREYPTDALMSKKAAFAQWQRLDQPSQDAARAAIPAFKAYCHKNTTYRPVHAQRFLSDRRFDGFNSTPSEAFQNADERGWRDRLRVFRDRGGWLAKYGPKPGEPGCKCPQSILEESAP
jgi:hypothetical protein